MKKIGAAAAMITPSPKGWRFLLDGAPKEFASMAELRAALPERSKVHLALPCHAVVLDRMTLPATDGEELAGMVLLQIEKTLPYPVEEVTSGVEVIRKSDKEESLVLSVAAHRPILESICAPLREAKRIPERVTLHALDLAPRMPAGECVLALWLEQDHLTAAIYEDSKLSWAQTMAAIDPAMLALELPPMLLGAELEGAPGEFQRVLVDAESPELLESARTLFPNPVEAFSTAQSDDSSSVDLLPPEWVHEAKGIERGEQLRQRLMIAAAVYLVLVACAFVYLAFTKRTVQGLDAEIAKTQPLIQATLNRQAKWQALGPALSSQQYAVELLFLANRNRPDKVAITQFDSGTTQFMVEGEAPDPESAINFAEKLRADKELQDYKIEGGQPQILQNGHAQFRIFGKL